MRCLSSPTASWITSPGPSPPVPNAPTWSSDFDSNLCATHSELWRHAPTSRIAMSLTHHHHGSDHDHDRPTPARALKVAIVLNASFLLLETVVGFWTNSLALLSDAGHMVSDVGALLIALLAIKLASQPPAGAYTFGLKRAPVLGGFLNAIGLIAIVIFICLEAVDRLQDPPAMEAMAVFWTGVAGLGVNLGSAWYLAKSRDQSVNTRGAMLHLLSDALGSVAAIVSAIAVGFFGLPLADPIASLVIALLILIGSWPLLRDTVRILLQRAPAGLDIATLKETLLAFSEVLAIDDVHAWELDDGQAVISVVIKTRVDTLAEATALSDTLRAALHEHFDIGHATVECRHADAPEPDVAC
ncbi:cation transporter [Lujinxingia sediminis]|uniref:Cation transporter n=2 Tax=Lujinxingia sediminis TaxID=2480984 RepID=A0ABY0CQY2_9DELT|nr:cation transporter [Lujinxingia sediminis]